MQGSGVRVQKVRPHIPQTPLRAPREKTLINCDQPKKPGSRSWFVVNYTWGANMFQTSTYHYSIRKFHGSPFHHMFVFFLFTEIICFLFYSWHLLSIKSSRFPRAKPKHQAPPNHQAIINSNKHLQNHTSFHSPQSLTPEIQHVNGKPPSLIGHTS